MQDLAALPIAEDSATGAQAWGVTAALSAQYRLTAHDAAYLDLALRLGLTLARLDRDLAAAGRPAVGAPAIKPRRPGPHAALRYTNQL